ncbi:hypothetical protein QKG_3555 [Clostridioides difficile DA00183]|nr:hypothetical protein QKG_3555 [Clostridioides difficile DA00183]
MKISTLTAIFGTIFVFFSAYMIEKWISFLIDKTYFINDTNGLPGWL